ncbi:MAG: hypothetical protein U0793_29630 [Gemmataceae bacterium]
MRKTMFKKISILAVLVSAPLAAADEPCRSGLKPGQRPGPYSALVCVGPQRGTLHCFICEAENRPIAIVFARGLSDSLGRLVHKLDKALNDHKAADFRAWVTFLAEDQTALDPKVVAWSKKHVTGNVPLAVFEDVVGPPAYVIAREADVTVLLSVNQKVVANFAYREGELNDAAIEAVLAAVPKITKK